MSFTFLFIIIVLFFYLLFPGAGALYARKHWKNFRENLIKSSLYPILDYHRYRKKGDEDLPGLYRFFGRIEAIQNENEIWLRNRNFTVTADLKDVRIYIVRSCNTPPDNEDIFEKPGETIADEMPQIISWNRIFSLPENSEMMISGSLFREKGKGIFRQTETEPLIVIMFDGNKETLLKRLVWSGRHRNEFWNYITPVSIITGAFALFIATYTLFSGVGFEFLRIFSISLSLLPLIPLFPPGVVLFFLYRKMWKDARFVRAERDIMRLPLRYFNEDDFRYSEKTFEISEGISYSFKKITGTENAESLCREKNIRIRESSADRCRSDVYYWFYCNQENADPQAYDPMLENLILCNNPWTSNKICNAKARKKEILSLLVFSAGLVINFIFTFYFLNLII